MEMVPGAECAEVAGVEGCRGCAHAVRGGGRMLERERSRRRAKVDHGRTATGVSANEKVRAKSATAGTRLETAETVGSGAD